MLGIINQNMTDIATFIRGASTYSGDVTEMIVTKLATEFTTDQQQMFLRNFFQFRKFDSRKDFVVDVDNVWEWLGFNKKGNCVKALKKYFVKTEHYCIIAYPNGESIRGGKNKEQVLMTTHCFKSMCLKSKTDKAHLTHEYYVTLEEIIFSCIDACLVASQVSKQHLEARIGALYDKSQALTEHVTILSQSNKLLEQRCKLVEKEKERILERRRLHRLKEGPCLYLIEDNWREESKSHKYKFGITEDINGRLKTYRTSMPQTQLLLVVYTKSNAILEGILKSKLRDKMVELNHEYVTGVTVAYI